MSKLGDEQLDDIRKLDGSKRRERDLIAKLKQGIYTHVSGGAEEVPLHLMMRQSDLFLLEKCISLDDTATPGQIPKTIVVEERLRKRRRTYEMRRASNTLFLDCASISP
ncbi:hypothetical protein V8E54_008138 [Elaphomyces granulatus]|jgi:hypothetical protein